MAKKSKSIWTCTDCGNTTGGWFGRCTSCGAWNTIVERVDSPTTPDRVVLSQDGEVGKVFRSTHAEDETKTKPRRKTSIQELDRVLGGGLVHGSVVLVGGPPGIGKSTLLLQACAGLAAGDATVLYASGEESVSQIADRATRLGAKHERLLLVAETRVESIIEATKSHKPDVLIVDSVQTIYSDVTEGLPGNVGQIRAVTAQLISTAKSTGVPVIMVGHVTKDGQLAGPRLLEHMVDAVLSFDGDEARALRMLRATKNRFGSTHELGVFEMTGGGLAPIENPSEAFLTQRDVAATGACVTSTLEGSRPLLLEVQALLGPSPGGSPRRTCVGADPARLAMLLAVLDRHAGLFAVDQDVFVNIAGGLKLTEPAADLAVLLAVASSHKRVPLAQNMVALGEVGLTGELRAVPRVEARIAESHRLGYSTLLVPQARKRPRIPKGLRLVVCRTVAEALDAAFD
jgi:DNA repair protein RadA/Sms